MAGYIDENGEFHEDAETTKAENASKASFKLDLIETVNADPALEASDLKLMSAYAAVMQWPKREAWLSISRARAMTGLSERQISNSRARLSGENRAKRTYLTPVRRQGGTPVFRVENPWREDSRQHVAIQTEYFREAMRERQAARRRHVSATSAATNIPVSQSLGECDVSAMVAGNIPSYTPQNLALREETSTGEQQRSSYAKASGGF